MAVKEKIRIRLKSYDASLIDAAAAKIVELSLIHISEPTRRS